VGDSITLPNFPPEISNLPQLPNFCHPVEWAIQLPYPICDFKSPNFKNYPTSVTRLSGQSYYPTRFATWNLQVAKITPCLSPGWVDHSITLPNLPPEISKFPKFPNFCYLVEWVIQSPNPISHLKSTHCQNYPISVTRLTGQFNYLTRFLSPGWVGNPITLPDLRLEIYKLPKLPHFCHPVEWAIQLPYPILQPKSPNCPNYPISVTRLSGQSNYLTWFATWNLHIAKITQFLSPGWVGSSITWPNSSHLVEWAIPLPYPICHLKSPNCQN